MHKNLIIGILIILVSGIFLFFSIYNNPGTSYYFTVPELKTRMDEIQGKNFRVTGVLLPQSLSKGSDPLMNSFRIGDKNSKDELEIEYRGILPDAFKEGQELVVVGKMKNERVFNANTIISKCPSKYQAEEK